MTVLTIDLGTSATKAALWDERRLLELVRVPIETRHPRPGWAEQDAEDWWQSVERAVAQLPERDVEAIGFSAARETFVLVDDSLAPLGPGILWSDRRGEDFVDDLGPDVRARTGVMPTGAATAAKLRWVEANEPDALERARWILAPRDFVVARLTDEVCTDETLASRTALFGLDGKWLEDAKTRYGDRLPPVHAASSIVGKARDLRPGANVVIGAGDRACETLGVGATQRSPAVSWGTTVNCSVPRPEPVEVAQVSRGALGGFLVEAGVSAAGAATGWLASVVGRDHDELLAEAAAVEPGAGGVLALPWLHGARAPWWRPGAHAAFFGITNATGAPELARALVEGIAFDAARSLAMVAPDAEELALAGGGAGAVRTTRPRQWVLGWSSQLHSRRSSKWMWSIPSSRASSPNWSWWRHTASFGPRLIKRPSWCWSSGGGARTRNLGINNPLLGQLSYPGMASDDSKARTNPMIARWVRAQL